MKFLFVLGNKCTLFIALQSSKVSHTCIYNEVTDLSEYRTGVTVDEAFVEYNHCIVGRGMSFVWQ